MKIMVFVYWNIKLKIVGNIDIVLVLIFFGGRNCAFDSSFSQIDIIFNNETNKIEQIKEKKLNKFQVLNPNVDTLGSGVILYKFFNLNSCLKNDENDRIIVAMGCKVRQNGAYRRDFVVLCNIDKERIISLKHTLHRSIFGHFDCYGIMLGAIKSERSRNVDKYYNGLYRSPLLWQLNVPDIVIEMIIDCLSAFELSKFCCFIINLTRMF